MDLHEAINHHLQLQERNAGLEDRLPLARYRGDLVDSAASLEPWRVLEETQEYAPAWLAEPESKSEDTDWGWEDE
jgi:hypothetical protein